MWVCPAVRSYPPSLPMCPLPSPKQGISRTFLFFSPSHRGAHILPLILRLRAPRREGAPTVARYCDLSTAVIIKLSMAVIVSVVSALPPCVR